MFDKNRETRDNVNDAANSVNEAAQEVKKVAQTVQTVKNHLRRNKTKYLVGTGVIVGTGVVGGAGFCLGRMQAPDVVQMFTNSSDNVATVVNRSKHVDIINKYLNVRNYNANPIRCIETGLEWSSQVEGAEAMNIPASVMSQHLNGKFPHAYGFHFERM